MSIDDLIRIAKATATAHQIDPALFCALVEHESSWDTWAVRYEPTFFAKYVHPAIPFKPTTEEMDRAQSFGLCQVMGLVARECGFTQKYLTELCDPVTGLEFGARKLRKCLDAGAGSNVVALLRYNGGGDASYADAVLKLVGKYK